MNRHQFLRALHNRYRPRNYLEIGIQTGRSLRLSRVPSIGIDPDFKIVTEVECDVKLVRATSDDFFAREDPIGKFREKAIDFAFIDGMHWFEYALRDFLNTEPLTLPTSIVLLDDMLPRNDKEAARGGQGSGAWAGDVFKVLLTLQRYRPDLTVIPVDTAPTGTVLVVGLDPSNRVLKERYDDIVAELGSEDPQTVPTEILKRSEAIDPAVLVEAPMWQSLRTLRKDGAGVDEVRRMLATDPVVSPWTNRTGEPLPERVVPQSSGEQGKTGIRRLLSRR